MRDSVISGHVPFFKTISISFVASRLIFKGLRKIFLNDNGIFYDGTERKPIKIRRRPCPGGTLFEISS